MKEQCFFVREVKHGRGVAVLSRDKTEVSRGGGRRYQMQEDGSQISWKNYFERSRRSRVACRQNTNKIPHFGAYRDISHDARAAVADWRKHGLIHAWCRQADALDACAFTNFSPEKNCL